MERLAAKKRKGILSRMPKESNEDILVGLKKAELAAGGRKATQADVESVNEELELANAQDKLDARKPAGKLKARPDINPDTKIGVDDLVRPLPQETMAESNARVRSMSDRDRRMAQVAAAAEGARYREALQPKKGFEEQYDADVKFQEEEYGGGSIRREMELDEIRGPRDPETGVREAALGEDAAEYDKQYAKLEKENPNMSETELQDAAIKAVRSLQARDAEDAAKDFNTVDYGDEMENEVRRKRLEAEAAEKERKERQKSMVEKAIGTGKLKGERITKTPDGTPIQEAARKYIESSYGPDKEASESKLARIRETADARRRNLPVDLGESESSGDLEFEPGESEVTEQEVEDAALEREYEARPTQSGVSRKRSTLDTNPKLSKLPKLGL